MSEDKNKLKPTVLWFTGLSGSGKSTISEKVYPALKERGYRVEHLDGDAIREIFPSTGFRKEERNAHIKPEGYIAIRLQAHGVFVIRYLISPYQDTCYFVRYIFEDFIEIHISKPLDDCEKLDDKGLYAQARKREIKNFTGISNPNK